MPNDYDNYAQTGHNRGSYNSHKFVEKPMMREMLPDLKDQTVLMLGCGTGEETQLLVSAGAQKLTGIDLSETSVKIAQKTYPGCNFRVGDMHRLPFEDCSFDFVYSSLTIHYSPKPLAVFEEVFRVLKPGGKFLFSVGHPLRWASTEIESHDAKIRVIGYGKKQNGEQIVCGDYLTYALCRHSFPQHGNEVLEFYSGAPSTYFKLLKNSGFTVDDFTESKCAETAKDKDPDYYQRFSKIPQFQAFLATKPK